MRGLLSQEKFPSLFPPELTSSGSPFTWTMCEVAKVHLAVVHQISSHPICPKTLLGRSPLSVQNHQNSPLPKWFISVQTHCHCSHLKNKSKHSLDYTSPFRDHPFLWPPLELTSLRQLSTLAIFIPFHSLLNILYQAFILPTLWKPLLAGSMASLGQELVIVSQFSSHLACQQHVTLWVITHSPRTDCLHLLSRLHTPHFSSCLSVSFTCSCSSQQCSVAQPWTLCSDYTCSFCDLIYSRWL